MPVDPFDIEYTDASNQQYLGITRLNKAAGDMGKVAQNASESKTAPSISEALNIHADKMKGFVDDLIYLAGTVR